MENSLYFYLEPYVYMRKGGNGILLVNFLDDSTFTFNDVRSTEIADSLLSTNRRTTVITEEDIYQPLVVCARKNYLGDIVLSKSQPLQFYSEINIVSEKNAYRKSVMYSKHDICSHINKCTIFLNSNHQDCNHYMSVKKGINTATIKSFCKESVEISSKELHYYTDYLYRLNANIRFFFCGIDSSNFFYIVKNIPITNCNFIFSAKTINTAPELQRIIKKYNVDYILILDLSNDDISICDLQAPKEIWAYIQNEEATALYYKLRQDRYNIKPFLNLNFYNTDFIKSTMMFSQSDIFNLKNKYRIIKSNNLINTNYWGQIYIFPNGLFSYSLDGITNLESFDNFYNDFKQRFFLGNFDWTKIRNYKKCIDCYFKFLCPSPTYIEDLLREQNIIDCLIRNLP